MLPGWFPIKTKAGVKWWGAHALGRPGQRGTYQRAVLSLVWVSDSGGHMTKVGR